MAPRALPCRRPWPKQTEASLLKNFNPKMHPFKRVLNRPVSEGWTECAEQLNSFKIKASKS